MVNTLKLRDIETCSPEIQTFLREIEQSFLQVLNNYVPAGERSYPVEGIGNSPINLSVTQLDDSNSSRYYYNYNTWNRNPDVENFELNSASSLSC